MVRVIAEVGSNHCGDLELAGKLISQAAAVGADVVKFQAFDRSIWTSDAEWEKRKAFAVGEEFLRECWRYATQVEGLEFMCTPCYPEAVGWLNLLVKRWKIASGDIYRKELIDAVKATGKPVLYSEGVWGGRRVTPDWVPMVCVSRYPAKISDYPLKRYDGFLHKWGISDHTTSHAAVIASVARGAQWVEKHLKLTDQPPSPDSGPYAYTPGKFARMVWEVREVEKALGHSIPESEQLSAKGRLVWHPGV